MRVANIAKTFIALGMLSLAAGLSGCSRGISGSTDHTTSNTPPTNCGVVNSGLAYLFFSTSDSTCPGKPLAVDAGTDVLSNIFYPATVFVAGSYDPPTRTVKNIHNHALVYPKTSGNFYKVSALQTSVTPTPTQLSSENSAQKICSAFAPTEAVDLANPDHSQFVYRTPGKNDICNDTDDVYKMVRLDMGPADAPVTAKQPIGTALHDWTTGAISGWLVNDAGALKKCDANFANCQASLREIKSYAAQVSIAGSNLWLVDIDHVLYVYNGDTNILSAEIHTMVKEISPLVTAVINDSNKFYFSTGKAPKEIYVAPVDGSASATLLVTAAARINGLALSSANTLLYWTNTEINAVSKTTRAVTSLVRGNSIIAMAAVNNSHVYYTAGINEAHPIAGSVNDDGSLPVATPDASWQGFSLVTAWNLTDGFATISQAQTIIRAEGYNALGIDKGFGGAKLRSFNTATTNEVALIGTVPTDIGSIYCSSSGANVLCNGSNASIQNDIFLLNAVTPNSLVRVTDTPTKGEYPIYQDR